MLFNIIVKKISTNISFLIDINFLHKTKLSVYVKREKGYNKIFQNKGLLLPRIIYFFMMRRKLESLHQKDSQVLDN